MTGAEDKNAKGAVQKMTNVISMKALLESGVHFGHRTNKWHPAMKPYIFTERNGIHIIDLQQTAKSLNTAYAVVRDIVQSGENLYPQLNKYREETAPLNPITEKITKLFWWLRIPVINSSPKTAAVMNPINNPKPVKRSRKFINKTIVYRQGLLGIIQDRTYTNMSSSGRPECETFGVTTNCSH